MQLAVNQFYKYQPASKWAFEVQFSNPMLVNKTKTAGGAIYSLKSSDTFTQKDLERISQAVVSITQPKYDIEAFTNCYGNFDFVIPMYDVNNIRLTVTFEDTDDCLISYKFLTSLMGGSKGDSGIPAWLNIHETILLTITEYNTYNYDVERPNTFEAQKRNWNSTSVKSYFCKMIEYTEPNYNRTSEDAHATTMTITFLAVPAQPAIVNDNPILTDGVEEVNVTQELENLTKEIKDLFKTVGYVFKSAVGLMDKDFIPNLKDVYADMMKYYGNVSSLTYAQVEQWYKNHALSDSSLGQCARGPNLLFQLWEYIESGAAAKGESRKYQTVKTADAVGKGGTGTTSNVTDKFTDVSGKYTTKTYANSAEFEKVVKENLKPGEYITFTYIKADGQRSQHIVFRSFDENATGRDIWWSDFKQGTATAMHSGSNFTIVDSFKVENAVIDSSKLALPKQEPAQQPATDTTSVKTDSTAGRSRVSVQQQPAKQDTVPQQPQVKTETPTVKQADSLDMMFGNY